MTKEKLKELMQEERPNQQILEVIDFRESDRGIEGELYLATVKMRTVRYDFDSVDDWTGVAENMPYPLGPWRDMHDAKIEEMLKKQEVVFNNALAFLDRKIEMDKKNLKKNPNQ